MLRSTKDVRGYKLDATDGKIGKVKDILFDDASWTVRYFVADTGKWLPGRKVLVSTASVHAPDWQRQVLPVDLTKAKIENCPALEEHPPVSRQMEQTVVDYYAWPVYWYPGLARDMTPAAAGHLTPEHRVDAGGTGRESELRSTHAIAGYKIHATDGDIGHVEDFLMSDEDWRIRYIIVDTRNWLPGDMVLLSPAWFERFEWETSGAYVDLTRQQIKDSPKYDPSQPVKREYEGRLFEYYGRPKYWDRADTLGLRV